MVKKLACFDFDGTLFNSPVDTPENRRKFEKVTGIPWIITKQLSRELTTKHKRFVGMRSGWWGRAETLEPPLVPNPAPPEWFLTESCEALKKSMSDPDCITVMMTGRHAGLKNHVLRICKDGKLFGIECKTSNKNEKNYCVTDKNIHCYFLGDNGPVSSKNKPSDTFGWKSWILEQFLDQDLVEMEIWEDREEHVVKFKELNKIFPVNVKVNHIC